MNKEIKIVMTIIFSVLGVLLIMFLGIYLYVALFYECVEGRVVEVFMEDSGNMYFRSSTRRVIVETELGRTTIYSDTAIVGDKVKVKIRTP